MVVAIHRTLGGTKINIFWQSSRTTSSRSSTSQGIKRGNTNCLRIFPRVQIVKYASVRKLRGQLADDTHKVTYSAQPSSEKQLQPITKSFNEEEQPRNSQGYAIVVQDLATPWIQSCTCEKRRNSNNVYESFSIPKSKFLKHRQLILIRTSL